MAIDLKEGSYSGGIMTKKAVFLFLVWTVTCGLPCNASAIMIWEDYKDWSSHGDMIIYNDTDAQVVIEGHDDWSHRDLLNDPNPMPPYSSKVDTEMDIKNGHNNKGFLRLVIEKMKNSEPVTSDDFQITTDNPHDFTYYVLELPDGNDPQWVFTEGKQAVSGAWAISEDDGKGTYVAQMYNERYVVTFFVNNNLDDDGSKWTGYTKIILLISKNDKSRFDDESVDSAWPYSWPH